MIIFITELFKLGLPFMTISGPLLGVLLNTMHKNKTLSSKHPVIFGVW